MFLAVYLGGFRPRCKATSRMQSPVAWLVVWEVGCLGDQVSPVPNNFHQTRARDLALCKGFLTNEHPPHPGRLPLKPPGPQCIPPPNGTGYQGPVTTRPMLTQQNQQRDALERRNAQEGDQRVRDA